MKHDIKHTVGEPERPQSNGIIERQVQEVKRGTRALLLHARHSLAMRSYAMRTIIFHRNHFSDVAWFDFEHIDRDLFQYGQTIFYRAREEKRENTFSPSMRVGQFLTYGKGKEIVVLDQDDMTRGRISILSTSTYRRPNKLEFLGMPRYYHENELNELIDFQTCQTCFLPKTNLDITCKRCIREIHKSRGALPLHALSIGCLEGRCNCTDGPSRTFDFDFDAIVDYQIEHL